MPGKELAMAHRKRCVSSVVAVLAATACGLQLPGTAATGAEDQTAATLQASDDTTRAQPLQLVREVFSYRGAGRDPFRSLVTSGGMVRPFLEDLRVTSIYHDPRYSARSVAVLRDLSDGKRYDVRVNDQVGRMRVAEIRPYEVVFMIEDFGVPRQEVLSIRRREGRSP
jgi:hypothetical protein